jgi:hypothetical protein
VESELRMKLESSTSRLFEVEDRYCETYRVHAKKTPLSLPSSRSYYLKESRSR